MLPDVKRKSWLLAIIAAVGAFGIAVIHATWLRKATPPPQEPEN